MLYGFPSFSQMILLSKAVNASGGSFRNQEMIFEWSLAEMPLTLPVQKPDFMLTAGILQPFEPTFKHPVAFPIGYIKVYPTIATDHIALYCSIPLQASIQYTITDFTGKFRIGYTFPVNRETVRKNIQVNQLERGLYVLTVQAASPEGQYQSAFPFIIL